MTILQERNSAHFPETESEVQSSKEACLRTTVQETEFKGGLVLKPNPVLALHGGSFQAGVGVESIG